MAVRGSSWCAGRGVCELSDCRRSWFACEARGVRGCAGGSGSSSSRLCPSASTWQLSRMQGPSALSLPTKQKQRAKFKAKEAAWPRREWLRRAANSPIQLHNPRSYWRGCKQDGIARGSAQRCCPSSRRRKRSLSLVRTCFTCMLPAPPGAFALAQDSLALGLL